MEDKETARRVEMNDNSLTELFKLLRTQIYSLINLTALKRSGMIHTYMENYKTIQRCNENILTKLL